MEQNEREKKVYNLLIELADTQNKRKSLMKGYTEEVKRIRLEIKDLIKHEISTSDV